MGEEEIGSSDSVLFLDSSLCELERLIAFLDEFCNHEGIPEEICGQLQVALEELVINAVKHGRCEPGKGAIRLAIRRKGDKVNAVYSDCGVGFNPLDVPSPDLSRSLQDRALGGLGIHLVRHFIPSIRYERRDGRNYLYLAKPVSEASGSLEEERHANGDGDNQT